MLRMVYDEPPRHRITQLIGNLSLLNTAGCQGIPVGHVTAHNADPGLQLAFTRAILESVQEDDVVSMGDVVCMQEEWLAERCAGPVPLGSTSQGVALQNQDIGDGTPAEHPDNEIIVATPVQQPEEQQQQEQQQQQEEQAGEGSRGRSRRSGATPVDAEVLEEDEEA
jgi:hypothetical protein